jgi:hypothetical protein
MTTLKFSNLHPWDGCSLPDQSFHQRFMRVTYNWRKTVHKIISQMWKRWDDWPRPVQCLTIAIHILWLPSALVHSSITDESMTPYWAISSSNPVFLVATPIRNSHLAGYLMLDHLSYITFHIFVVQQNSYISMKYSVLIFASQKLESLRILLEYEIYFW